MNVSTTIVDQIAIRLLPQKEHYRRYKFEESALFKEIRRGASEHKLAELPKV